MHAGRAAQPEPGPLCLHLQRMQAPRGDTLPLHRLRGEEGGIDRGGIRLGEGDGEEE